MHESIPFAREARNHAVSGAKKNNAMPVKRTWHAGKFTTDVYYLQLNWLLAVIQQVA
jgi:hypothetical protein